MINKSMSLKNKPQPFLLSPACKQTIWGGNLLKTEYNKHADFDNIAESWECSTHPDGISTVASGAFCGQKLSQVLQVHPEYVGSHPHTVCELPILIKFIDAKRNLSIQVHPDDDYACNVRFFLREDGTPWDEENDPLPPSYDRYTEAIEN